MAQVCLIARQDTAANLIAGAPYLPAYTDTADTETQNFATSPTEGRIWWIQGDGNLLELGIDTTYTFNDTTTVNLTATGTTITADVLPAGVDHDALLNFVANEHIDHSTVSIITAADSGLSGGGDLTASRTLVVDINGTTAETSIDRANDFFLMWDASASALRKVSAGNIAAEGPLVLQGTYNASTNTPALVDGTGVTGQFYQVTTAGIQNFGSGNIEMNVGDWIIYDGASWYLGDNSSQVNSVNGATGNVVLGLNDINDVSLTAPANTNLLQYNGTNWVNVTPASLGFVSSFTVTDGTTPATISNGGTITFVDGGNLDFSTTAGGNVSAVWSAAISDLSNVPALPGAAGNYVLQYAQGTNTFTWESSVSSDTNFLNTDLTSTAVRTHTVNNNVSYTGTGTYGFGATATANAVITVGGAVETTALGYILASANGTRYRITVNNAGILQVNPA